MNRRSGWLSLPALLLTLLAVQAQAQSPENKFANPSFELGRQFWTMDKAGRTVATFDVSQEQAADGQNSALLTVGAVESWGVQFGQRVDAGQVGKTYTFAAMARSAGEPVKLSLQIERGGAPYDRAASTGLVTVTSEQWTELHTTFTLNKPFPEGWFAYVECQQANAKFRLDMFRLYEGPYVSFKDATRESAARTAVTLFDTASPSKAPLDGEAMTRRAGWAAVPEDTLDHRFSGDAILVNHRLALVLRHGAVGAELYSLEAAGARCRGVLRPLAAAEGSLTDIKTLENNPGEATVQATYRCADGKTFVTSYDLKTGQPFIQIDPGEGVSAVRVEAPCRYAVLPDFFADDLIVDAAGIPVSKSELPSENFLLQLLGGGDAMLMSVWMQREQDISIALSGQGQQRRIDAADIPCGKKGKLWVAVLAAPGIWHHCSFAKSDAGKIIPLSWAPPMPAHWRIDLSREDQFSDSWEFILEQADGQFIKTGLLGAPTDLPANRKRWNTVLGSFAYPCWIDQRNKAWVQPLTSAARFDGPALVYPIARARNTPLEAFTVVDIVRATMGVGPCEYVLDVEGQGSQYKGRATCANRDALNPIYTHGQQKQRKAEVERSLVEVMIFVHHIRDRIEAYVDFGHQTRAYLADQGKAHPELAGPLGELDQLAQEIDRRVEQRRDKIKTPAEAQAIVDAFRKNGMDDEGPEALAKCKAFTAAMVEIGGNQDELAGECRLAVRMLRQRAALLLAADPRLAEVCKEIRLSSQKVLRNPANHEGAGH